MRRVYLYVAIGLLCAALAGCGGGGSHAATGSIEGYVYVPSDVRAVRQGTYLALTRGDTVPEGYVPLAQAKIEAMVNGQILDTTTDGNGHFLINGVTVGKATFTVTPPAGSPWQPLSTTVDVAANSNSFIGQGGRVSLLSADANSLSVVVNRIDTSEWPRVKAYVSVIDPYSKKPLIGLGPSNFALSINGSPAKSPDEVQQVSAADIPISVALVLDRSGSMTGNNYDDKPLHDLQDAARQFVNLLSPGDECAMISLGDDVRTDQPFTDNKSLLISAVDALATNGGTPLFDAVWEGITQTADRQNPRKAVIALTDGGENASSEEHGGGGWLGSADVGVPVTYAQQKAIPVYAIGLQGFDFTRGIKGEGGSPSVSAPKGDVGPSGKPSTRGVRSAESDLQRLANETGGEYFYAPSSDDLTAIYSTIRVRTQQQYVLTITAPDPGAGPCNLEGGVTCSGKQGDISAEVGDAWRACFYSQKDVRWADYGIPNTQTAATIGDWGCLLTSMAIVMKHAGATLTNGAEPNPKTLDDALSPLGFFVSSGDAVGAVAGWNAVPSLTDQVTGGRARLSRQAFDRAVLDTQLAAAHPVIVHLPQGKYGHWVVVIRHEGGQYYVHDPAQTNGSNVPIEHALYWISLSAIDYMVVRSP